jgi:2-aminoadipate transaminase
MDAARLLDKAIRKNVAFVCGSVFYCNNEGHNTLRMNFSYAGEEDTREGIRRLAEVIREEMAAS